MKFGLISFAHVHADSYATIIRDTPGWEIAGIWDDDLDRGREASANYKTPFFENLTQLLDTHPDGVIISSENRKHTELILSALERKIPILCEKPLTINSNEGECVIRKSADAKTLLMPAFPLPFSPPLQEVAQGIKNNKIGKVICCRATNRAQLPKRYRPWFVSKKEAGGGAIIDHVVHVADWGRRCFQSEVADVYALENRLAYPGEEVETGGQIILNFDNGIFLSLDCSWSRPLAYPTWGGASIQIIGEDGVVEVDAFRQNTTLYSDKQSEAAVRRDFWGTDINHLMISEFVSAVTEKREPLVSAEDGLRATEIIEAAYRSVETGQPENVIRRSL